MRTVCVCVCVSVCRAGSTWPRTVHEAEASIATGHAAMPGSDLQLPSTHVSDSERDTDTILLPGLL